MEFGCTSCGICCQNLRNTFENFNRLPEPWRIELAKFPYPLTPTGACSQFVNGRCKVYKDRPLVCNVERMHMRYFRHVPRKAYFNLTGTRCNQLMDAAKSTKKRVKLLK